MKESTFLILFLFLFITACNPDDQAISEASKTEYFEKKFGTTKTEYLTDAIMTSENEIIAIGYYDDEVNLPNNDFGPLYLIKTNLSGELIWEKIMYELEYDFSFVNSQIIEISTDEYLIFSREVLLRIDTNGNILSEKATRDIFQDTSSSCFGLYDRILRSTDGSLYIIGIKFMDNLINGHSYLAKLDSDANFIWEKTFGNGIAADLIETQEGNIAIAALGNHPSVTMDIEPYRYLATVDPDGNLLSEVTIEIEKTDNTYQIEQSASGGFIITGNKNINEILNAFMLKFDAEGNLLMDKTIASSENHHIHALHKSANEDYFLFGYIHDEEINGHDLFLAKLDDKGNVIWKKKYGDVDHDIAGYSLKKIPDNGFLMMGASNVFSRNFDAYLIKTDENGNTE